MYSVADYGRMAADAVRMDAYSRAILAKVRPGAVVLDLGAGTGIVALLAARAGARRVHAVDPNPAVWLIPELAEASGLEDKIVVHQSSSLEMAVPEPIDVVISDMRGAVPLLGDNISALRDIRQRWLAPGGVLIPARDRLQVSVIEGEAVAARLERASTSFEQLGFPADATRRSILNQVYSDSGAPFAASEMLSSLETWALLDYATIDTQVVEGTVTLEVVRGGTARGLSVSFDTELCEGVRFTTAPGHAVVYGRMYLPFVTPTTVAVGDRVRVTIRGDIRGERWAWDTAIERAGARLCSMRQATFLGVPASMASLLRSSETHAPKLTSRGERLRDLLAAMDGTRTVRELADKLASERPEDRVSDMLEEVKSAAMSYGV